MRIKLQLFYFVGVYLNQNILNEIKKVKHITLNYIICRLRKLTKLTKFFDLNQLKYIRNDIENGEIIDISYLKTNIGKRLIKKLEMSFFDELTNLRLGSFNLNDKGNEFLSLFYFPNMRHLYLNQCNLTSKGIKYLSKWDIKSLESIDLSDNFIRDDGIIYFTKINCKKLKILNLSHNCLGRSENKLNIEEQLKNLNSSINDEDLILYSKIVTKNENKAMGCSLIDILNICYESGVFNYLELINLKGSVISDVKLKELKLSEKSIIILSFE